jgi:RTX calcium-binding nonapeptide repeat (4 copies)
VRRAFWAGATAAVVAAIGAVAAIPAGAHHSILIREVRASSASPGSAFVELQAYRQGQNDVRGATIQAYDQTGLVRHDFQLTAEVPRAESQRTILIGGSAFVWSADFVDPGLGPALSPAGGAVCFPEAIPPDCVSWGAFGGAGQLPFPGAGPPAPAIAEGSSLDRTIARDCPRALDDQDDTHSSAGDFALGAPSPRPNGVAPTEVECVPCAGTDATIVGTEGADELTGTPGRDVIAALSGADRVSGLAGPDVICGGLGKDLLRGGRGRDRLLGERGRDKCIGGRGKDAGRSCERSKAL